MRSNDFLKKAMCVLAMTFMMAGLVAARCEATEYMTPEGSYYICRCTAADSGFLGQDRFFDGTNFNFTSEYGQQKEYYGKIYLDGCLDSSWDPFPVEKCDGIMLYAPNYITGMQCCDQCGQKYSSSDLYDAEIWLEGPSGNIIVPKQNGLRLDNIKIPSRNVYVCFHFVQKPKERCSACGEIIGGKMWFSGIHIHEPLIRFIQMPVNAVVAEGQTAAFELLVDCYDKTFRWEKKVNGEWVKVSNGAGIYGERYVGAETNKLTVNKVSSQMYGTEYRCVMIGSANREVYTDVVTFKAPQAQQTTTSSSSSSSTSTTPAITPGTGSSTSYKPSDSSSAYVNPAGGGGTSSGGSGNNGKTSHESTTSHKSNGGGDSTYKGRVDIPQPQNEETGIISKDPGGATGTSSGGKGGSSGKGLTTRSGSSAKGSSLKNSSTTGRYTGGLKNNYVTKNGVLYIVDDDSAPIGTEGEGDLNESKEESFENEEAYSAADLAEYKKLQSQDKQKGFWQSIPGYITIGFIALVTLLALLFFLFFGVIVFGEVEEHDEVFELCAIRILKRREGEWCVDLGSGFDDNAVLKLRIGLLFAVIFDGWDITGYTHGVYEGHVEATVSQPLMLYRKKIRRSV